MAMGKCDRLSSAAGRKATASGNWSPPTVRRAGSSRRPAGCRTSRRRRPSRAIRRARGSCARAGRRITLQREALLADALGRVEPHPQRHGVDEEPDHRLDARQFVGAPRTRVTPNTTSSRSVKAERMAAHAIWSSVLTVTPRHLAPSSSWAVACSSRCTSTRSGRPWLASRPVSAGESSVGPARPSRWARQPVGWLPDRGPQANRCSPGTGAAQAAAHRGRRPRSRARSSRRRTPAATSRRSRCGAR